MIISEDVKIKINLPISNEQVENKLKELKLNFIRWAITDIDKDMCTIRVSHIID